MGGRRWLTPLAGMSVLRCTAAAALDLPLQLYLNSLGATPIVIGLASTLTWLGMLIGGPVWGSLGDRFSKKLLLWIILPASSATFALLAVLLPPAGTVAIRFVRAAVIAGFAPVTMALMSGASTSQQRGTNLSYVSSARALGWVLGGAMSGFVLEALGFRGTFAALACLPLLCIGFLVLLPSSPQRGSVKWSFPLRYLTDRWLGALYSGVVLRQLGIAGSFSLIFIYMARSGILISAMGLVSALPSLAQVLGLIAFGRLSDRVGRRRIFLLGFGLSALPALFFAFSPELWGMSVGHLLVGVAFSALYIGSTSHIGDVIPSERHGVMLGLFDSARAAGGVLGPLIAGAVIPFIDYAGMFVLMSGISFLGFILVLVGTRRPSQLTPSAS
jgi:MFS family permease